MKETKSEIFADIMTTVGFLIIIALPLKFFVMLLGQANGFIIGLVWTLFFWAWLEVVSNQIERLYIKKDKKVVEG